MKEALKNAGKKNIKDYIHGPVIGIQETEFEYLGVKIFIKNSCDPNPEIFFYFKRV